MFGSMEMNKRLKLGMLGTITKIKVYPLLTHALKKLSTVNMRYMPMTGHELDYRVRGLRKLLETLQQRPHELGGYRMEVTVSGVWSQVRDVANGMCTPEGLTRCVLARYA